MMHYADYSQRNIDKTLNRWGHNYARELQLIIRNFICCTSNEYYEFTSGKCMVY